MRESDIILKRKRLNMRNHIRSSVENLYVWFVTIPYTTNSIYEQITTNKFYIFMITGKKKEDKQKVIHKETNCHPAQGEVNKTAPHIARRRV